MKKGISLYDIAKELDLSYTTVCKVINRDPNSRIPERTKKLVFKKAKGMRYDIQRLYKKYRRAHERKAINIPVKIIIRYQRTNRIYDRGKATIVNISPNGALISGLCLPGKSIPVTPFVCELSISEDKKDSVSLTGKVMRLQNYKKTIALGLIFIKYSKKCREKIESILLTC